MENKKFLGNFVAVVFSVLAALYFVKIFDISYPITLVTTNRSSELAVVGEGKVEAVPDIAYIDAGITVNKGSSVAEVQKTINEINNKIIDSLKRIGIEKTDIKTSNYSINPNYTYENNERRIEGYNGDVSIEIKVKNPQMASKVIESATQAGANQIRGSRFVVDKPEIYREEARNAAIKNAREQANKIAKNLGIRLGKITNLVESLPDQPVLYKTMMADTIGLGGEGESAQIEPGSQTITSTVTLYFERK